MSILTSRGRRRIKDSNFAIPEKGKYPIHDKAHARAALVFVARYGTEEEKKRVCNAIKRKYPGIKASC